MSKRKTRSRKELLPPSEILHKLSWSVPEWGRLNSISRALAYREVQQGRIQATLVGKTKKVITREAHEAWRRQQLIATE
jgi:hypothetical protein